MPNRDHKAAYGAYGVGCINAGPSGTEISHLLYCEASLSQLARRSGDRLVIRTIFTSSFAHSMQVGFMLEGLAMTRRSWGVEEGLLQAIVVMPCLTVTGGGH